MINSLMSFEGFVGISILQYWLVLHKDFTTGDACNTCVLAFTFNLKIQDKNITNIFQIDPA